MSESLQITSSKSGSELKYVLKGAMNEHAKYPAVSDAQVTRVLFDFEGVDLINSTGLQSWIAFLQSIPTTAQVVFSKCSQRVINQLNLFPGFTAGRKVVVDSFYAPYFCESCDESRNTLLTLASCKDQLLAQQPPAIKCVKCGAAAQFDSIPKKYFLFASWL